MKKTSSFVCQECGYDTPKFLGKCPECGLWNTMKEFHTTNTKVGTKTNGGVVLETTNPQALGKIVYSERSRISTTFQELNTVLGGGIVAGSAILLAGDPGVGKSTLLLQLCLSLSQSGKKVLYISGEESVDQIKMRALRIDAQQGSENGEPHTAKTTRGKQTTAEEENLFLIATMDPDNAIDQIEAMRPDFVVVDSVQTMQSGNVAGLSGSVGQVRYAALHFIKIAKTLNIPIVLVGHVTKEGMVAGPMVLSHMVDAVLFLEGEKFASTRILRSLKNRFGPVDEVGIFQMMGEGMQEVVNPEQLFLSKDMENTPGNVIVVTMEGSRAFLVELQALAVLSRLPMPRRVVSGVDQRRVELLLAVLQKHCRLPVETMDIFVNVAGGMKLSDPAIDLGICLAIYSSVKNIPLSKTVGIAEVGLLGELRSVPGLDKRMREAKKLGFKQIITAQENTFLHDVIESLGQKVNN